MPEITSPSSDLATSRIRPRDASIQALRGVAVILMVAGHVIGTAHRGLHVADHSLWQYLYLALADIRMPMFTLISGYVYAMVPVAHWRHFPRLVKGKSRRLLLPLITVGTVLYLLERVAPGTNYDPHDVPLWRVYVFGFEHLWFLQSIFVIFLVIGLLDSSGVLAARPGWYAITAIAAAVFVIVHVPTEMDVFTVSGVLRLLPFFLLGYGLRRHSLFDRPRALTLAIALAFAGAYAVRLVTIFDIYHPGDYMENVISLTVGATAVVLIYSARNLLNTRALAWIGSFSFGIYLLHVFATAATRVFLEHVGMHLTWELFAIGLLMGLAAPIAFQLAFRNVSVVQTFVFGERMTSARHSPTPTSGAEKMIADIRTIFPSFAENRGRGRHARFWPTHLPRHTLQKHRRQPQLTREVRPSHRGGAEMLAEQQGPSSPTQTTILGTESRSSAQP
jgi:acyltransferase